MSCSTLTNVPSLPSSPDGAQSDEGTPDHSQAIYAEFDDDFEEEEEEEEVEEEEPTVAIGNCTAMYNFPGMSLLESPSIFYFLMYVYSLGRIMLAKVL